MSCNKCNLSKCGCQDSYLTTPPPCPVPSDCPEEQPCSEVFDAQCIVYTGLPITCGEVEVVSTNFTVSDALASITSFFCDQLATNENILCGEDIVVPADTQLEDALILIVTYFCTAIDNILPLTNVTVFWMDSIVAGSPCLMRTYTLTFLSGTTIIDTVIFESQITCSPEDIQTLIDASISTIPTYDLDSIQNGADADIRLIPSVGLNDIVKLEAGTNITLTDTGSNIKIDAAGGGGAGGLTWITQSCASDCAPLIASTNHGYININQGGTSQQSIFILPTGANVGDVVKILIRSGLGKVTCDATEIISFGQGSGVGNQVSEGQNPIEFTSNAYFHFGQSEMIQFLYIGIDPLGGPGTWIIDTFTTGADQETDTFGGQPMLARVY